MAGKYFIVGKFFFVLSLTLFSLFPPSFLLPSLAQPRRAVALFSYVATYEDELTFRQGDILSITETSSIEEGWFQGQNQQGELF